MNIEIIPAYGYPQEVGVLFSEYTKMLIDGDSSFRDYLAVQHYDEELAHLEMKYGLPWGRLYLAEKNRQTELRDEASLCPAAVSRTTDRKNPGRKDHRGWAGDRL